MLPMAGCLRARPGLRVVASKQMQKIRRLQAGGAIRKSLLVDQQRKRDSSLLAKQATVAHIAEPDGGEIGALGSELLLMIAQLRNMLAAEDSSVVTKENNHGGPTFPQRTKPNFAPIGVGKRDIGERIAERLSHRPDPSTIQRESTKEAPTLIFRAVRQNSARFFYPQIGWFVHKMGRSELHARRSPHYDHRSNDEEGSEAAP
jgi:hypothetical protein